MTIKELCKNCDDCDNCTFQPICDLDDGLWSRMFNHDKFNKNITKSIIETAALLREDNRLTNREWIDFLTKQFNVSRRSARNMLHYMMGIKKKDTFNKQFCGSRRKVTNNG